MSLSFTEHRLVASDRVVTRVVGDATVLLNVETGRSFRLDRVGTRAWALLTAAPSIQHALDALLEEFDAEAEQVRQDLDALIEDLASRGLGEVRPSGRSGSEGPRA